ncbi:hypothetical protein KEM60_03142 [Austwickia sp. TVS 96-490-7B]|uniref:WXG100 family type VII secretion target n=1 Tax=Austwickia sp. TVS 96-490-7B TaxID=2830843 RepID=UPI001C582512|nr:WXG100 family type VII secretion target [Austwickia sp. TVS 96-490-7B]MBW3086913.1 hypothetical protein [Austwickia sp. TVS 96-490-7B]
MGQFSADIAALRQAATEVAEAKTHLTNKRDSISKSVDSLISSGWQGNACKAYTTAWREWCHAADEVLAGLDQMGRAISASLADYQSQDEAASRGLARSAQGLHGGRSSGLNMQ